MCGRPQALEAAAGTAGLSTRWRLLQDDVGLLHGLLDLFVWQHHSAVEVQLILQPTKQQQQHMQVRQL